jgi:alpha-L-fucosidase 2
MHTRSVIRPLAMFAAMIVPAAVSAAGGDIVAEALRILARQKAVFTAPPKQVPTRKVVDGPILGNGDLGVVIGGSPELQRFYVSKNDFWKTKSVYPNAHPCPIGGIDVSIPALVGGTYHIEQMLSTAEALATLTTANRWADPPPFTRAGQPIQIRAWTPATENLLVIELSVDGNPKDPSNAVGVDVALWPKTGDESETASGNLADGYWATRKFIPVARGRSVAVDQSPLKWTSEASMAVRLLNHRNPFQPGGDGWSADRFLVVPGAPVTIVAAIVTSEESEHPLAEATRRIAAVTPQYVDSLRRSHQAWWRDFWAKSYVEIGDPLIEKFYYASNYIMACCSRNKRFAPSLFGNWVTADGPSWQADYHLNYNHQAPWWGIYSSNHVELSEPYDTPILEYMPIAKENARRYLKIRGVYYEVGIGPKGLETCFVAEGQEMRGEGNRMFLGAKSNALLCATNMFMRFYSTYDLEYAKRIYPFLIETADFWNDYLKFKNGRYVVYGDALGEAGDGGSDKNNIYTLGLLRTFFKGIIDISKELNADAGRQEKWQHFAGNLSRFPTATVDGIERFRMAEAGPSSGILGPNAGAARGAWNCHFLGLVWPAGNIGLGSDPRWLKIARDEVRDWPAGDWFNKGTNAASFRTTFASYPFAARVGHDPSDLLVRLHKELELDGLPNLWLFTGGGGIEQCSCVPSCINEMLLQSHEGVIRLFPVWPKDRPARFGRLRACGAFLVSAEFHDGEVRVLMIESEKGRPCTLQNPWPSSEVWLERNGKLAEKLRGGKFTFSTSAGERCKLRAARQWGSELQRTKFTGCRGKVVSSLDLPR